MDKMIFIHIIIKTLNVQGKERILKTTRDKEQVTFKGRLIRIINIFFQSILKTDRTGQVFYKFKKANDTKKQLLCQELSVDRESV